MISGGGTTHSLGRWIALEGGEGSGKSTQARLLAVTLGAMLTREPGGTEAGGRIRQLLLDPALTIDDRAEALLMAADRAQHWHDVVGPALDAGQTVVSDRSAWSSLAYQGHGRGLGLEAIRQFSDWALRGRWPDLAVLIDVPAGEAAARLAASGRSPDRLEAEGGGFHDRVRDGFASLVETYPDRWCVVDGCGTEAAVAARVAAAVQEQLGPAN